MQPKGNGITGWCVGAGGFHLHTKLKNAKNEADWMAVTTPTVMYKVLKAIVPAGTEYYKGEYNGYDAICVRKVRYEEI